jgi:CRISPR-associated protein Csm4
VTRDERAALQAFTAREPETHKLQTGVLWRTGVRPRVTVDRVTSSSAVYAVGGTQFNPQGKKPAGLYTVIEWLDSDAALRQRIRVAFKALGETGIGGERSSGHGQFEPEFTELSEWNVGAAEGSHFTTLSPYVPREVEKAVLGQGARYEIVLRRGWLSLPGFTNVYRGTVRLLAEGSVLRYPAYGEPLGMLAEMTPARVSQAGGPAIYRYGLAFPVRVADEALRPREGEA